MIPGLSHRLTSQGVPVIRCHYSSDPRKRPGTPAGDSWRARTSAAYVGGTNSADWRREYEIDWNALGGHRVFPEWEQWVGKRKIVIPPFFGEGQKLYGSYDHGWRNPASFHVWGVDFDGDIAALWEFYGSHVGVPLIARILKGEDVVTQDGRRFTGNPYAGKVSWTKADPSMWSEDQSMSDGTNKSVAELFRREGVYLQKGEKGGDTMVAEWLHGHWWKDQEKPKLRLSCPETLISVGKKPCPDGYSGPGAPMLIWEIGQQRHREFSARVALNREQPEELVDKDNHAWDDMKMFLKCFPPKPTMQKAEGTPGSFNWWRAMEKRRKESPNYQRTFRV